MSDRRGLALVMMLAATVVVGSLVLVALQATLVHARLVGDARWRIEGSLVASTALGRIRLAHQADLDTLSDGGQLVVPETTRADHWSWSASAVRSSGLIQLTVDATRRAADGTIYARRRASLLLARNPADTVRVLASRARF